MKDHTPTAISISGVVLAGGRGNRFGGADKGLIEWRGKALVAHVLDKLLPDCQECILVCNRNSQRYAQFGHPVISDRAPDYAGPLAGIAAAATTVSGEWVLISACDTPVLPSSIASQLLAAAKGAGAVACYPRCGTQAHYLPVIIRSDALSTAAERSQSEDRSMAGWLHSLQAISLDFDSARPFSNINSEVDLSALNNE